MILSGVWQISSRLLRCENKSSLAMRVPFLRSARRHARTILMPRDLASAHFIILFQLGMFALTQRVKRTPALLIQHSPLEEPPQPTAVADPLYQCFPVGAAG